MDAKSSPNKYAHKMPKVVEDLACVSVIPFYTGRKHEIHRLLSAASFKCILEYFINY